MRHASCCKWAKSKLIYLNSIDYISVALGNFKCKNLKVYYLNYNKTFYLTLAIKISLLTALQDFCLKYNEDLALNAGPYIRGFDFVCVCN